MEKKGENVRIFDMRGVSAVTDFFLVVTGTSPPHLKALGEGVRLQLKEEGSVCYRHAGDPDGGWVALDYFDVIIHVFSRQARAYYAIEELWEEVPQVD